MNLPVRSTFVIKTLGCKVNQYESQAMRECLIKNGFVEEKDNRIADYYIINSCTVTHRADSDTRNLIHHFRKINPDAKIMVAGCYVELDSDRNALINIPGVTYLVRNTEKEGIADILMTNDKIQMTNKFQILPPSAGSRRNSTGESSYGTNSKFQITDFKDRSRAFIKIQDGCNHRCSYCKVPLVRGRSRSRNITDILREIKGLLEKGFKEIVLAGVCLGAWGRDLTAKPSLAGLIKDISGINGLFRIRLSSIEPIYVTDKIIDVLSGDDKVCKHLHLPLQSGDDRILKAMQRPYTTKKFEEIVKRIKKNVPDVAITTDVLVGFPGEGDREFHNTLKFIEEIKPSRIHIFSYSKREGTLAAKYKNNPDKKRLKEKVKILLNLSKKLSAGFAKSFTDRIQNMLVETHRDKATGLLTGYTDRYIRVYVDGADSLRNRLIPIRITGVDEGGGRIFGRLDNDQII